MSKIESGTITNKQYKREDKKMLGAYYIPSYDIPFSLYKTLSDNIFK